MSDDIYSMTKAGFHETLRQAKEDAWEQGKNAVWAFMSNQDPRRERPANPYMLNNEGEK